MKYIQLICLATASISCFAQNPPASQDSERDRKIKEAWKEIWAKEYRVPGLTRTYKAIGATPIPSLSLLHQWLRDTFAGNQTSDLAMRPEEIMYSALIVLRTTAEETLHYQIDVRAWWSKSFDESERYLGFMLTNIPIVLNEGGLYGPTIGDWTRSYYSRGSDAMVLFLRKNVFVRVAVHNPVWVPQKKGPSRGDIEDPSIKEKCEKLAREIDEQLNLPIRIEVNRVDKK